jgi:quinol monooxygenase YgiN
MTGAMATIRKEGPVLSTVVITQFFARPGRGGDVERLLLEILGDSLKYEGGQTISIIRDQDSPDHVAGVTRWRERRNYQEYLAGRTERGFTATFEDMLTQPLVLNYYDESYSGTGIAAQVA